MKIKDMSSLSEQLEKIREREHKNYMIYYELRTQLASYFLLEDKIMHPQDFELQGLYFYLQPGYKGDKIKSFYLIHENRLKNIDQEIVLSINDILNIVRIDGIKRLFDDYGIPIIFEDLSFMPPDFSKYLTVTISNIHKLVFICDKLNNDKLGDFISAVNILFNEFHLSLDEKNLMDEVHKFLDKQYNRIHTI
jgi:hypothetical protein